MTQIDKINAAIAEAKKIVFGQDQLLEAIITALVCDGHLLIEGMPGLGKTLSVSVMSKLCDLTFQRVQFTPDLLPSDLIGTMIYNQQKQEFSTKFGPVFTQLLLADEINRSPAKVQSALLEAMAEKQVTIGEQTHRLGSPFVVLATQNPIDQEGTYQLPEAQLDRFMMKILISYPPFDAEKSILELQERPYENLIPLLSSVDLQQVKTSTEKVYVDNKIKDLIVRIVHATRPGNKYFPSEFAGIIAAGASPRACLWLYRISKFKAFLAGQDYVSPDEILSLVPEVLAHRIIISYEAAMDKINVRELVTKIAQKMILPPV